MKSYRDPGDQRLTARFRRSFKPLSYDLLLLQSGVRMKRSEIRDLAGRCKDVATQLTAFSRPTFVVYESDMESSNVTAIVKHMSLYAERAIFVTKPVVWGYNEDDQSAFQTSRSFASEVRQLIGAEPDDLVLANGSFVLIPQEVTSYVEYLDDNDFTSPDRWYEDHHFKLKTYQENLNQLPTAICSPSRDSQLLQYLKLDEPSEVNVTPAYLPNLTNVPVDVILRLREDEAESFARFHHAIGDLLTRSRNSFSESAFLDMLREVDYEVRLYREKMETLANSRQLSSYEAFVSVTAVGLCAAVPSPVGEALSAILGTYSTRKYVGDLFAYAKDAKRLKESDFYVPWRLGTE